MSATQKERRRGSQEFDEADDRSIRPPLHRMSSGIEADAADSASTGQNQVPLNAMTVDDIRRWSNDSGFASPRMTNPGPPTFGRNIATSSSYTTEQYIKEHAGKQKLVMSEFKSKIARSHSQSEIEVKALYGLGRSSGEKKEKPIPMPRYKKKDKPVLEHTSTSLKEPTKRPPLSRSRTLPSSSNRDFWDSTNANLSKGTGENREQSIESASGKGQERSLAKRPQPVQKSKSSSFRSQLTRGVSKVTRSVSTRLAAKPKKFYSEKKNVHITKEPTSDSESYENSKPLSSLQKSARFSRSLDELDGYDWVQPPEFEAPRVPKSAGLLPSRATKTDTNGDSHYEVFNFDFTDKQVDDQEKRYSTFSEIGFVSADGNEVDMKSPSPLERHPNEYAESTKTQTTMTKYDKSREKPIPKQRQNVSNQHKQPIPKPKSEPIPKRPKPYLPPGAKENQEMAERVIGDIMAKDPRTDITEIVIQTFNFVAKYCDENGGFLEVGSKMATLLVPPYAIEAKTSSPNYPVLIYMQMEESHVIMGREEGQQIAPVIHCGTPGTQFRSPVILTFLTSVQDAKHLTVTGLRKESSENDDNDWRKTKKGDGKVVSLDKGMCTMMLNHFTNDTLVAKPKEKHFAKIHFIAFTSPVMKTDKIFDIRVWISSNEDKLRQDETREVQDNHAKRLGLYAPTIYLFEDGGDLNVEVAKLTNGWITAYPQSELKEMISIHKLQYDSNADGIRESCVFYVRPAREFIPYEAVTFDILLFQTDKKVHGVKLPVHIIPELEHEGARPGQLCQFRAVRQPSGWKPSPSSLENLERCLSVNSSRWKSLAAWLHLDVSELECFPSPVTGMLLRLYNKHAPNGSDYIRRAIEELEEPLDRLGSDMQEASEIVKDMLGKAPPSRSQPEGTVVVRHPTEDSWPQWHRDSPLQVNEYRFYTSPRAYHTLRSDDGLYPLGTSEPLEPLQVATAMNINPHQFPDQGSPPATLSSNLTVNAIRSAPVPIQQNWPQENQNHVREYHEDEDTSESGSLMVPKGIANHRKSSGYATIGYDIDPNRPQANLPDTSGYHYDQPEPYHPQDAAANKGTECVCQNDEPAYEGVEIAQEDLSHPVDLQAIARGEPEPPYVNVIQDNKPGVRKGYVKNIPNSKVQH